MKKPLFGGLKNMIEKTFSFRPGQNQLRDLTRLIFEITKRENLTLENVITYLKKNAPVERYSGRNKFIALKNTLIEYRFPQTSKRGKIDAERIFLNKLSEPFSVNLQTNANFKPLKIFVEKEVKKSQLLANFQRKLPDTEIEEVDRYSSYLKENKFRVSQLKKPFIFIVKERGAFIKRCPCSKQNLNCGYWIINLGFGCPFDCSYCFLQQYSNFPGIILPANIEDFFISFDKFYKNLKKPIRIGTGEFSDSLALDDLTEYSKLLIPYFGKKNVFLELKTKSKKIANLLKLKASKNIIISWSLNPDLIIKCEEKGTATLEERLVAAGEIQDAGFGLGFHFDPIIQIKDWKKLYRNLIAKLYSNLKGPFAWISLGTLRSRRQLKTIVESRFPQSNIFYGELFLGRDKKLRYPEFIKKDIYQNLIDAIRLFDQTTPIYLCMEDAQTWTNIVGLVPDNRIANSLVV